MPLNIFNIQSLHLGELIKQLSFAPFLFSYESGEYWNGSYPAYHLCLKEILESDIEGEKAAIAHYRRLITEIDNESFQALFARIILDEERHIEVLSGLYARCF